MKTVMKKIYCPDCRSLVSGREEVGKNGTAQALCVRCGRLLYVWDGIMWKPAPPTDHGERRASR